MSSSTAMSLQLFTILQCSRHKLSVFPTAVFVHHSYSNWQQMLGPMECCLQTISSLIKVKKFQPWGDITANLTSDEIAPAKPITEHLGWATENTENAICGSTLCESRLQWVQTWCCRLSQRDCGTLSSSPIFWLKHVPKQGVITDASNNFFYPSHTNWQVGVWFR